jgi:toxin-antitoxin system PIN domain toxin
MTCLPDVNVWIALAVAQHIHHALATQWFEDSSGDALAFCRITQMGFLRLLGNRHVMGEGALAASQCWKLLDGYLSHPRIQFVPEPTGFEELWRAATGHDRKGANFWTDAYLAAFAAATGYTLVTFDTGLKHQRAARVRVLR